MDIEALRKLALGLPHATEDVKWGSDLCFCIAGKMFCVTGLEQAVFGVSLKVRDDEFDEMCSRPGISPAPYVARYKWVWVQGADTLTNAEWEHYVRQSYELVKAKLPAKVRNSLSTKHTD